jgi:PIN domain nuclease of toxin-antitoxin system
LRLLLDSHVVLWWLDGDETLSHEVFMAIEEIAEEVLVSAATVWELEIKRAKGKVSSPLDLIERIENDGFLFLDVTAEHGLDAARLPRHHGDPFDRVLVAQAQAEAAVLVTDDEQLREYAVPVMPARG